MNTKFSNICFNFKWEKNALLIDMQVKDSDTNKDIINILHSVLKDLYVLVLYCGDSLRRQKSLRGLNTYYSFGAAPELRARLGSSKFDLIAM